MSEFLYIEHITAADQRWDHVADAYYGDPLQYGRLVSANPSVPVGPFLPAGLVLRVPLLSERDAQTQADASTLPPWKRPLDE